MGVEKFEKWVNLSRFGQRTGIDLPGEHKGIAPIARDEAPLLGKGDKEGAEALDEAVPGDRARRRFTSAKCGGRLNGRDYDMASSAFGQGQNASTPIQLLRYSRRPGRWAGSLYTPHLLLRAAPGIDRFGNQQPETATRIKAVQRADEQGDPEDRASDGMSGVVKSAERRAQRGSKALTSAPRPARRRWRRRIAQGRRTKIMPGSSASRRATSPKSGDRSF